MNQTPDQDFGTYFDSLQAWSESSHDSFVLRALDCSAIVAVTDARGRILSANDKFVEISGYTRDELIGQDHRMIRSDKHDKAFFRRIYQTIARGEVWQGEICNRRKNGEPYWVDTTIVPRRGADGTVTNYVAIRFDITARKLAEQRLKASRQKLQEAVNTDYLTNIANRTSFSSYLRALLEQDDRRDDYVCLGLLDVDTFKAVNDTSGHESGDRLIKKIAERLRAFASPEIFVARIGGDEFAIVMIGPDSATFEKTLAHILATMRFTFRAGEITHHVTSSLGYTISPLKDARKREIMHCADLALYEAKAEGRNRMKKYAPFMKERTERRVRLRRAVQEGFKRHQFRLFYQPVLRARGDRPPAFEALLRWNHPERGVLGPHYFHEAFEDAELSATIGNFVRQQALADIRSFLRSGLPFDRIGINVTSDDFRKDNFAERLLADMRRQSVPPERLTLEITEKMLFGTHNRHILEELEAIHRAGVEISLDDFGTGFASLTHLRSIVFDHVKIDRVFTAGVTEGGIDAAIIRGVIDIVHSMGRTVVAEGVETEEQTRVLREMGCDAFQGWHFSKAVPPASLPGLLDPNGPPWIRTDRRILDVAVAE